MSKIMSSITKEHGVVMLATKDNSSLQYVAETDSLHKYPNDEENEFDIIDNLGVKQHLYFISDEEIKEGDLYYSHDVDGNFLGISRFIAFKTPKDKKVVATTDTKLTFLKEGDEYGGYKLLPQIPQSFVESYIKNPVETVLLEYEEVAAGEIRCIPTRLKVRKLKLFNNEVVVVNSKAKLYTREEVEVLIRKCRKDTYNGYSMNKWIKENLD